MAGKEGRFKIIEQFLADGMYYMFGNPGTSEEGFLDALSDYPDLKYILTLQESIAVMMADGYARATKHPALVQLHSTPGIGNGVGALYQAKRGHAPLVVIGGDAGIKYMNMDAQMAADLVAFMEPVTKYSTMITDPNSVLRTIRRAIKIAATPPLGPVYVCLPMDVLEQMNNEDVIPTSIPSTRVVPSPELIQEAAGMLSNAKKPVIFIGDGVAYSNAVEELTRVAEILGAEVYGVDIGDLNMDTTHPLYQGSTGHMFGSYSLPITQKGDVILIVGTYMLPEVFPELGNVFTKGARVVHFDLNSYEIAKNHPVDLGVVSDPNLSLKALADALETIMSPEQKSAAKARADEIGREKARKIGAQIGEDKKFKDKKPLRMSQFMEKLAARLPKDAIIFDEALTSSPAVTRYFPPKIPGNYFVTRGGSLGVGIPGAIGAKLANPDKTVIAFTGDGGSMYTIQALWTAARYNIGAKSIICNNGSYKLLELNIDEYWKEKGISNRSYPTCFDLTNYPIRFDLLAKSMGVEGVHVEKPEEIDPAIDRMLSDDRPFLIDLIIK
jgi:benzoylformate decarboxylase